MAKKGGEEKAGSTVLEGEADAGEVKIAGKEKGGAEEEKQDLAVAAASSSSSSAGGTFAFSGDAFATEGTDGGPDQAILRNLVILPPRQKKSESQTEASACVSDASPNLVLPPIRAEEPVQSLRAALAETVGYAHLTCFRFELETTSSSSSPNDVVAPGTSATKEVPLISPYTGKNAVVSVPHHVKSLDENNGNAPDGDEKVVLDEYGDLTPLLQHGLTDGCAFRIVLERYDPCSSKDHVMRLKSLLEGNVPAVVSLMAENEEEGMDAMVATEDGRAPTKQGEKSTDEVDQQQTQHTAAESPAESNKPAAAAATETPETKPVTAVTQSPPSDLPEFGDDVVPDGSNLQDFFYLVCGENAKEFRDAIHALNDEAPHASKDVAGKEGAGHGKSKKKKKNKNGETEDHENPSGEKETVSKDVASISQISALLRRWNKLDETSRVQCSIRYSGFHPPPPVRRWVGDLAYLEVIPPALTVDTNDDVAQEPILHITATPMGFYVNRSSTSTTKKGRVVHTFDPAPAQNPCYSHTLLDCLLQASPSMREAWTNALKAAKERLDLLNVLNGNGQLLPQQPSQNPHPKSTYSSFFRTAFRGDFGGFTSAASACTIVRQSIDGILSTPSWLFPLPKMEAGALGIKNGALSSTWNRNGYHPFNLSRTDEDLCSTHGVDVRNGAIRDWNEELQLAREMPTETLQERVDRARLIHKVLTEFGEASLLGCKAIADGHVAPMNPNEPVRSQVYLHNNIFFSRAVDAGPETFKIAVGDRAARKASNRDVQCISTLHRMEKTSLYTLATVLVDYLGTRFVCQSILPGILIGEKSHSLLYGAVESGTPLAYDEKLQELLQEKIGEGMMVATRKIYRNPLTDERMKEIQEIRKANQVNNTFLLAHNKAQNSVDGSEEKKAEEGEQEDPQTAVISTCLPMEAKGILGSDQRRYVLDLNRLTPRDANWVPADKGGTGKWEAIYQSKRAGQNGGNNQEPAKIPESLEDDEWTLCVLRPELVTRFTQVSMARYIQAKQRKEIEAAEKKTGAKGETTAGETKETSAESSASGTAAGDNEKEKKVEPTLDPNDPSILSSKGISEEVKEKVEKKLEMERDSSKLSDDDLDYLKKLRLNVNVFLPHMRSFDGVHDDLAKQVKEDEERVREVSVFLWDEVLPKITRAVKDGTVHQIPVDGRTLTELLHRNGVNCRYLGRLAVLAREQEERDEKTEADLKQGRLTVVERRTMPKCWLELLECEMVARAGKHVLDRYFVERGGIVASQPAQTIASFLSALVSEGEESAAQTEMRVEKEQQESKQMPDEEDFNSLTLSGVGGDGDAVPPLIRSRQQVWDDIEQEVGRRFRYSLTLYNTGNKSRRALYIPLLRRICQRAGIRLVAKNYEVGGKCLCSGGSTLGGRLTASYPISPLDVCDIVPLMKHAAAYNEGFSPCACATSSVVGGAAGVGGPATTVVTLPSLQVALHDARVALERAHIQTSGRSLGKGLELAQEAAALYQRVTENAAHPGVIESLELMATIFLEAGDPAAAAANGMKALTLTVQNGGFDSASTVNAHMSLFQMWFAAREFNQCVKHLRAALYLLEVMAGPNHVEHFTAYHKLGSVYSHADYNGKYLSTALSFFQQASQRDSCDRLMEGITSKNFAKILAGLGEYKDALEAEKKAYRTLSMFLGREHQLTVESDKDLKQYTALAVEQGNRAAATEKMREESLKAEAVAADLAAEEEQQEKKKNIKKKKNKK